MRETYTIEVDPHRPLETIKQIQDKFFDDVVKDFKAGLEPDGGIPRTLVGQLAAKYHYTYQGINSVLRRRGLLQTTKRNIATQ